jgi:hypothetical protein
MTNSSAVTANAFALSSNVMARVIALITLMNLIAPLLRLFLAGWMSINVKEATLVLVKINSVIPTRIVPIMMMSPFHVV